MAFKWHNAVYIVWLYITFLNLKMRILVFFLHSEWEGEDKVSQILEMSKSFPNYETE